MNRPKWKTIVGVLTIIIGLWGIVNQVVTIGSSSYYLAMESEKEITQERETQVRESTQLDENLGTFDHTYNEHVFRTIAIGVISLLISGAYVLAGLFLRTKSYGIRMFYYVMAVSILWTVVQTILVSQAQLEMFVFFMAMKVPSIAIDVILATAVFLGIRYQPPGQTVTTNHKLLADAASIFSNPVHLGIPVITGAFAALCALILPFWIMGVPGVENDYARGWNIGLDAIMYYPIAWIIMFGLFWGLKRVIPLDRQRFLNVVGSIGLMIFFAAALLRLGQAFQAMAG